MEVCDILVAEDVIEHSQRINASNPKSKSVGVGSEPKGFRVAASDQPAALLAQRSCLQVDGVVLPKRPTDSNPAFGRNQSREFCNPQCPSGKRFVGIIIIKLRCEILRDLLHDILGIVKSSHGCKHRGRSRRAGRELEQKTPECLGSQHESR